MIIKNLKARRPQDKQEFKCIYEGFMHFFNQKLKEQEDELKGLGYKPQIFNSLFDLSELLSSNEPQAQRPSFTDAEKNQISEDTSNTRARYLKNFLRHLLMADDTISNEENIIGFRLHETSQQLQSIKLSDKNYVFEFKAPMICVFSKITSLDIYHLTKKLAIIISNLHKLLISNTNHNMLPRDLRPFAKDIEDRKLSISIIMVYANQDGMENIWSLGINELLEVCINRIPLDIKNMLKPAIVVRKVTNIDDQFKKMSSPVILIKSYEKILSQGGLLKKSTKSVLKSSKKGKVKTEDDKKKSGKFTIQEKKARTTEKGKKNNLKEVNFEINKHNEGIILEMIKKLPKEGYKINIK